MDDSIYPPYTSLGTPSDSMMDLDYMDELLVGGCWLQATDGSEFLQDSPSISNPLFDPLFLWPTLEGNNNGDPSGSSLPKDIQEERQRSSFPENLSITQSQGENFSKIQGIEPENTVVEGSELSGSWWIGPEANHKPSISVMERLILALENIKAHSKDKNKLIQVWLPVNKDGRKVLSTSDQPFSLDWNCPQLANYRNISVKYQFPADEGSKEIVGLPGRVFKGKVPEWTPDVRFFRKEEYPRVVHALQYDVRGSLAVPVFDQGSRSCIGVIEVVTTAQKINCSPELESVRKALEDVDLRSSAVPSSQKAKVSDGSYQDALPEILEVLKSACETHGLPLAQTWVPCIRQGKGGCRHSDENFVYCISTVDSACFVSDPKMQDFHKACSEHHLLKDEGVAGRAFTTNQPCFSPDVTSSSKTEYPLSHHARMLGLCAAVAIRLRSTYTGTTDYVLEFFLPVDCEDPEEQKKFLNSLSIIIQKVCRSLRTITEKELQEETIRPVGEVLKPLDTRLSPEEMVKVEKGYDFVPSVQGGYQREILTENSTAFRKPRNDSSSSATIGFGGDHSARVEGSFLNEGRNGEKRRAKAEKTIDLQTLRQYFAGSLKDAAKSIGVCPTTLKRICRQHGIQRWPSRKIKKVGHSLEKIQRVMDSVQGASGTFQIKSFYSNFPELAYPNSARASPLSASDARSGDSKPLEGQPAEVDNLSLQAAASKSFSSSCSQSSSSGQSCSSGTHPDPHSSLYSYPRTTLEMPNSGDGVLKRARSDAVLLALGDNGPELMPRSQSHQSLGELPKSQSCPPIPKSMGRSSREGDVQRVKVTYGEDKVRFRLKTDWGYKDLQQEIARKFSINDLSGFDLKYLDDDSEWVLLTCDADLEECIDVCKSCQSSTIKLSLRSSQHHERSSLGSNTPF